MYAAFTIAPFDPYRNIPSAEFLGATVQMHVGVQATKKRARYKGKKTQEVKSARIKEKLRETSPRAPIYNNDFNTIANNR